MNVSKQTSFWPGNKILLSCLEAMVWKIIKIVYHLEELSLVILLINSDNATHCDMSIEALVSWWFWVLPTIFFKKNPQIWHKYQSLDFWLIKDTKLC